MNANRVAQVNNVVSSVPRRTSGAEVMLKFPPVKPQQPQNTVIVVPEKPCRKNCCPILSSGCDISCCASEYYLGPLCNLPGITGLVHARPCLMYDEEYMGCGTSCIGCERVCQPFCPFPGYLRPPFPYGGGNFNNNVFNNDNQSVDN
jgi:hypothetical protein